MSIPPYGALIDFPLPANALSIFLSEDSAGHQVIPQAPYTNANGIWIPAPTDESGNPYAKLAGSSAIYAGAVTLSTTAVQLASQAGSNVILQSALANTETILFGNIGTQSMELAPGASATITVNNLDLLYVVAASGTPTLNWMVLS